MGDQHPIHLKVRDLASTLHQFVQLIGLVALLALTMALLQRSGERFPLILRQGITGIAFGVAATVVMLDPIRTPEGAVIDPRGAILMTAGVIAGPLPAAVAAVIAAAVRGVVIGGPFALGGVVGIGLYAGLGSVIWLWLRRTDRRPTLWILAAAAMLALPLKVSTFFIGVPPALGAQALGGVCLYLFASLVAGTLVMGGILIQADRWTTLTERLRQRDRENARFARLARDTSNLVAFTDANGCLTWMNDGFSALTGVHQAVGRGQRLDTALGAERRRTQNLDRLGRALDLGQADELEVCARTADGGQIWLRLNLRPVIEDGASTGMMAVGTDITQSKHLEANLIRAEQVGRLGHWTLDVRSGAVQWSRQTFAFFGLDPKGPNPTIHAVIERYHPDDRAAIRDTIQAAIAERRGFSYRRRILPTDGSLRWVDVTAECDCAETGEVQAFFGIIQDVTEEVLRTQDLERAIARADEAGKARLEFLATMSHELRTPLNAISGYAEVMAEEMFGPHQQSRYRDYSRSIHLSAGHLTRLIDDVLAFARESADAPPTPAEPVMLSPAIRQCVTMLVPKAQSRTIQIVTDAPDDLTVLANARALRQIIVNILDNAIKYSPPGAVVTVMATAVETSAAEPCVTVAIIDRGIGIPADAMPRIGEPFFRAHAAGAAANTASIEGSGIGLSVVRKLLNDMNGHLDIHSVHGAGTTVRITLPRAQPVPADAADGEADKTTAASETTPQQMPAAPPISQPAAG